MELTQNRTVKSIALLLLLAAISQPIYTAFFLGAPEIDRRFMWRFEGIVFVLLAAFSGSALVFAKRYALGFSAITFNAVFKLLAVGLGLTQFGPFTAAAALNADLSDIATSTLALSFFSYNSANILLGLAAMVFGIARYSDGGRVLGSATALVGGVAFIANTLVMMFGFQGFLPSPVAGGSGVLTTLLLAICLFSLRGKD